MNGSFARAIIICLALVMALAGMGAGYAGMQGGLQSNDLTVTSCGCGPFTWVVSNDDGAEDTITPYGTIDPGDVGGGTKYDGWGSQSSNDPSEPQEMGTACARYDKDVARTTAWVSGDDREIHVLVQNAYPGYYPTVFFGLKCPDSNPGTIMSITVENDYEYALTVSTSGIYEGQTIPAGEEIAGAVHVRIEQAARQNHVYTFKVLINVRCQPQCQWQGQTAMAEGNRYPNHSWFMYTPYQNAPFTVDLIAAQHYKVGTVRFYSIVDGKVTITITLDEDVRFVVAEPRESVKGYTNEDDAKAESNWPFGTWPYKGDVDPDKPSFSMEVPAYSSGNLPYLFYAVHVNVEYLVCP